MYGSPRRRLQSMATRKPTCARTEKGHAMYDVLTVVELFQRVYRPRLEQAGLDTYESIAAFAKRTPVAKCRELVQGGCREAMPCPVQSTNAINPIPPQMPAGPFSPGAIP